MIKSIKLAVILILLVCLVPLPARIIKGKVIKVHDGDTITVLEGRVQHKVRLNGIDCPELGQAFGRRAREFSSTLVYDRKVKVIYSEYDRYDRVLGTVFTMGGANLNHELVRAGLAWHYTQFSKDKKLAALEKAARKAKRGIWSASDPIPPWQFRQRQ